mmetsp:Transcript_72811/g.236529  ORF Transcript_72811/g.236529 Transcript_72811/m.236529 type:complete len:512 (-) Transcript_72811:85-1620(-)
MAVGSRTLWEAGDPADVAAAEGEVDVAFAGADSAEPAALAAAPPGHPKVRLRLGPLERRKPLSSQAMAALPAPVAPRLVGEAVASGTPFVARPMEPQVARGRGMHILGFVRKPLFDLQPKEAPPPAALASAGPAAMPAATPDAKAKGPAATPTARPEAKGPSAGHPEARPGAAAPAAATTAGAAGAGGGNGKVAAPGASARQGKHDGYNQRNGSYRNYYGYRRGAAAEPGAMDPRLGALAAELGKDCLAGLKVLDIGCNTGEISLAVARHLGARRVIGCDIDESLVEAAISNRDALVESSASAAGGSKASSASKSVTSTGGGSCKVTFRAEDFLESPLQRPPSDEPELFEAILCFSVTKWIHFVKGDAGIRKLFKRVFKRLTPGGIFVLEPQEWSSYKKKRHLSPAIRQTVAGIEMRPEAFDDFLLSIGFERKATIAPPAEGPQGFRRSIRVFTKPAALQAEPLSGEAAALESGGGKPTKGKKRRAEDAEEEAGGAEKRKRAKVKKAPGGS